MSFFAFKHLKGTKKGCCFLVGHWRRLNCVGSLKVLNNVTLWAPNLSFINLKGQDSLKIQEISKIVITIYLIVYVAYILITLLGKFVSVMYKKAHLESDFRKKKISSAGARTHEMRQKVSLCLIKFFWAWEKNYLRIIKL